MMPQVAWSAQQTGIVMRRGHQGQARGEGWCRRAGADVLGLLEERASKAWMIDETDGQGQLSGSNHTSRSTCAHSRAHARPEPRFPKRPSGLGDADADAGSNSRARRNELTSRLSCKTRWASCAVSARCQAVLRKVVTPASYW